MHGARILDDVADALVGRTLSAGLSVGFSGGVDSSVLLHAVMRLVGPLSLPPPRVLHVNHGLARDAVEWSRHCARQCRDLGVRFESIGVDARAGPGESPEEAARRARYAAFAGRLGNAELLCLAQHADDQAETVLLQLLRGAGPAGLRAMPAERELAPGRLLRPLLGRRRAEILACAREWGLSWVEDPANADQRLPRNRLREQVVPLLEVVNPGAVRALGRAARLQGEAEGAVRDLARLDLGRCMHASGEWLDRDELLALPSYRRRAALRLWLREAGTAPLGEARLREAERQLAQARADRQPRIEWRGAELRVQGPRVFAYRQAPAHPPRAGARRWRPGTALELSAGRLWAEPVSGEGLRADGEVEVRFRQGGERCRPSGRARSQSLKRLLQEYRVPAWERSQLPLLYRDGLIVGVADLWVCAGHEAAPGEAGWRVHWLRRQRPIRLSGPGSAA
jgi:tRNA(Ile)-lysidine synthase